VHASFKFRNQQGFSLLELMVGVTVMLIITSALVTVMRNAIMVSTSSYEVTDAQESLRTAQEYINRDLMNAGDGLKSLTYIPVNTAFVVNYLTAAPIPDGTMPTLATNLGILTTDNNVLPGTTVPMPQLPALPLFANTDRQTILEIDPDLVTNPQLFPSAINAAGDLITLPPATSAATMASFTIGDIYFLTSQRGGTFAAITGIDAANKRLTFGGGDFCGLNNNGANNRIKDISASGTLPTTLQRMRIIHYFIDSNRLLKRRVFGERGAPFRDTTVAEHVLNVQFVYSLGLDSGGNPVQPTDLLTTPQQQVNISQVEVTVTVETPHVMLHNGVRPPPMSMTTSTSLRNMQFRQALQPSASPTP
jgi:prepilin-type N-terminal cleavage/methylation domain-containing protein